MKKFFTLIALFVSLNSLAQSPKFDWVTQEGNGSSDFGWKIRRAPNGDLYVVILFQGSTNVGGTTYQQMGTSNGRDMLICKYNSSGTNQWVKQVYCSGYSYFPEMETDGSGNLYINQSFDGTLTFNSNNYYTSTPFTGPGGLFLTKIDNSGNVLWAKIVAKTWGLNSISKMAVKTNGDVFIIGYDADSVSIYNTTYNTQSYNNGGIGVFYLSILSNGSYNWHSLGEKGEIYYKTIKFDNSGNYVYGTGTYSGSHTFINNSSSTITSNANSQDVFFTKLQAIAFASCIWAVSFGSSSSESAEGLEIDANNNIFLLSNLSTSCTIGGFNVTGTTPQTSLAKFNGSGICSSAFPVIKSQNFAPFTCNELLTDLNGNLYASGYMEGTLIISDTISPQGSSDALIIKINPSNSTVPWYKKFGGNAADKVKAIPYNENELYCTGEFTNTATFGTFQKTSYGATDPFIAKLSGCDFPAVNITYNGNTTLCNGQSLTLNVNQIPNAKYKWLKNGIALTNDSALTLVVSGAGVYSIDVNLGGACRDTFGSVTVTSSIINATIQSAQPSICVGGTLQLYTNLPYTSYQWSTGVNTPTITINQPDTYSVIVSNGAGCLDTADIIIGEYPQPPMPTVLVGSNCQLASSVVATGYSYKWRLNGNVVGNNSAYLNANQFGNGFYTIEISDINGCKTLSNTPTNVTCSSLGTDNPSFHYGVTVYPNPFTDEFAISYNLTATEKVTIVLTNSFGQELTMMEKSSAPGGHKFIFNSASLKQGIYFINFIAGSFNQIHKVVLIR